MNPLAARVFTLLSFFVFCSPGFAQDVYVTKGERGPVFSDKPQTGAKEVKLKPLSVVPAVPVPSAQPAGASGAQDAGAGQGRRKEGEKDTRVVGASYRSFSIVSPQDNGSIAGDTPTFEVRLAVDPPLALAEGHAFVVRINGRFVDQRFTAAEFMIPPEFWADGYLPANQELLLEASIVDGGGQIVTRTSPVTFRTRQVVINQGYYPNGPIYVPGPVPPPFPVRPPKPRQPVREESRLAVEPAPAKNAPPFSSSGKDRPAVRKDRGASRADMDR